MFATTCENVPGYTNQILGLVRGNVVTSKHVGRDMMAGFKSMVGGEIVSYTQMTNEGRDIAEQRMMEAAHQLGADAVVMTRFSSSTPVQGTIEMLCYGTAVKLIPASNQ